MASLACHGCLMIVALLAVTWTSARGGGRDSRSRTLPSPNVAGRMTVEKAIAQRRSIREFADYGRAGASCTISSGRASEKKRVQPLVDHIGKVSAMRERSMSSTR